MRVFQKTPLALGVAAGMAMLVASTGAQAASAGTDLNLSAHTIAGGMAGAAYTKPQEVSAAVFGNPATLTQFPGVNFNFGATHIFLTDVETEIETTTGDTPGGGIAGALHDQGTITGTTSSKHTSDADNYIVPTLGLSLQVSPNLFIGLGLEADAGLGADYRDDPIDILGNTGLLDLNGNPMEASIPLLVEVISFNANISAAYKATEKLSLGAAITIGFGLAQLGTAGQTSGLSNGFFDVGGDSTGAAAFGVGGNDEGLNIFSDFGGTTSSVHDLALGWSLGATYEVNDKIMTSLAVKGPVEYQFDNIIYMEPTYANGIGVLAGAPAGLGAGWQKLDVEQPLEVIAGIAYEDGGLLVEADVIWKNWGDAAAYEDAYDDQFKIALGTQYTMGKWSFRGGYSWTEDILRDTPNTTLGSLQGLGSIPLGDLAAGTDGVLGILPGTPLPAGINPVANVAEDVVNIVQMSLLPVIWQHNITTGVGYNFTDAVSVNAFASYAFGETESRTHNNLLEVANLVGPAGALGVNLLDIFGPGGISDDTVAQDGFASGKVKQNMGAEIFFGIGINVELP